MQESGEYGYDNSHMTPVKVQETTLGMRILDKLVKEFPGYSWWVDVNFDGQVCSVRTEFGGQWGYVLHLDQVIHDPELKLVRWAAGELLERYNLSREKADHDLIDSLPVNSRGFATPQQD